MEDEVKRVFEMALRLTGEDYRSLTIDREDDGWTISIAGTAKKGSTVHTTLFGLEQALREKIKVKRTELRSHLAKLGDDEP